MAGQPCVLQLMQTDNQRSKLPFIIGALGVVYGDIGTSPLYALRECFSGLHGANPSPANVMGVVSLVFWTLSIIVCIKYLALVMRANNRGEGGILALLSLAVPDVGGARKGAGLGLVVLGVFGAALLYGDGMITPAVTVLGAVEGLGFLTPALGKYVTWIAALTLVGIFSIQKFGTGSVGKVYGPVMLLWFTVLGALGIRGILMSPEILGALSPHHGMRFLMQNGSSAFFVLGAVFLSVTGVEGLYADMGHFGPSPIRRAWYFVVFPGLILNYLGEGGLLLADPSAARNPFYLLAPNWALLPLVLLATAAAIIASQALISGAYSLTMQGIQLGLLPRMHILHTSHAARGQIYIPKVNWVLMIACLTLVFFFQSSSRLAAAYGVAVSFTMLATTCLFFAVARIRWKWPLWAALPVVGLFATIEGSFAAANSMKVAHGGWFPLAIGFTISIIILTWRRGRQVLRQRLLGSYLPFEAFLKDLENESVPRVPGIAVFLSGSPGSTPIALLHNLRHNKILHQNIILLTLITREVPMVPEEERVHVEQLRPDIHRVIGNYGFMEQPNVPDLLELCGKHGLKFVPARTTYFLSRETLIPRRQRSAMPRWRSRLFAMMARNAQPVSSFFQLPPNRVVELGMQVEI